MTRLSAGPAAICLFLLINVVPSHSATVQLCVAATQLLGAAANNSVGRDQLIKFLKKEKPDKNVTIEEVPIDASLPDQALAVAKQKNCDYVVTTNQVESHIGSNYLQPMGTMSTTSSPTYYVTTAYKLNKVSDGAEVASGSFKASDNGSEQNALGFTMHKIAGKVNDALKKAEH